MPYLSTHPLSPQTRPTAASAAAQASQGLLWAGQQLCLLSSRSTDLYTNYQKRAENPPHPPSPTSLHTCPFEHPPLFPFTSPCPPLWGALFAALKSKQKCHQLEKVPVYPGPGCFPGPQFSSRPPQAHQHAHISSHLATSLLHSRDPAHWTGLQKPQAPSTVSRSLGESDENQAPWMRKG